MALLLALLVDGLPVTLQEEQETGPLPYGWIVETRALWTGFDNDLRIEDGVGYGLEGAMFSKTHGANVSFQVGATFWETENERDEAKEADVRVRQYHLGMGVGAQEDILGFMLRIELGAFTYSGGEKRDADGFFQLGLQINAVLFRHVGVGLLGQVAFTHADFNRGSEHAVVNPSIGLTLGVRF